MKNKIKKKKKNMMMMIIIMMIIIMIIIAIINKNANDDEVTTLYQSSYVTVITTTNIIDSEIISRLDKRKYVKNFGRIGRYGRKSLKMHTIFRLEYPNMNGTFRRRRNILISYLHLL
jgi:cell division protein YceG involved in septum cleavage